MEPADDIAEDAAALKARRERVRHFSSRIADAVEDIPTPACFLEAERAARTLTVADRLIVRVAMPDLTVVKPQRLRIRIMADDLLDTIEGLTMPDTFLEAERAGRCALAVDRLLTQLYEPPKRRHEAGEDAEDFKDEAAEQAHYFNELLKRVDNLTYSYAYECGYWRDGTPLTGGERLPPERFAAIDKATMADFPKPNSQLGSDESLAYLGSLIATLSVGRTNAATRFSATATGWWPDGTRCPHKRPEEAPAFYSVSKNTTLMATGPTFGPLPPAPEEASGPRCMPGWIVRKKPPD